MAKATRFPSLTPRVPERKRDPYDLVVFGCLGALKHPWSPAHWADPSRAGAPRASAEPQPYGERRSSMRCRRVLASSWSITVRTNVNPAFS
jgi:hypothetical protein